MTYPPGNLVRLTANFTDEEEGLPIDPTTVTFTYTDPQGNVTTVPAAKDSVGAYHYDLLVDIGGTWWWRATGSGNVNAVSKDRPLYVDRPDF